MFDNCENAKLVTGSNQRLNYKVMKERRRHDASRIQEFKLFRMGVSQRTPGRPFERACRLSQNHGTAMFRRTQETLANWSHRLQQEGKTSPMTPPYPGIESMGLNGTVPAPPGKTV
jgi:hypothetical protein